MYAKVINTLLFLVLITLSLSVQACQDSASSLQVLSLQVMPIKTLVDEKVSVKAEVKNYGNKAKTYEIPLLVNGVADDREYVTLAPGGTETILFSLRRSKPGVYTIRIGKRESTLEVREPVPATFKLSNLEINPAECGVDDKVIVKADIKNVGEVQGKYTAELKVDGIVTNTEEMIMKAGSSSFFSFTLVPDSPGIYTVNLGELTGQLNVLDSFIPPQIGPSCPPGSDCTTGTPGTTGNAGNTGTTNPDC